MDVRSENETGKLLFKWDPKTDIVSISCKDTVYDIKLIRASENSSYRVVGKRYKKVSRASPRVMSQSTDSDKSSTNK